MVHNTGDRGTEPPEVKGQGAVQIQGSFKKFSLAARPCAAEGWAGFCLIRGAELPSGEVAAVNLPGPLGSRIGWGTTAEFDQYGKDHCAAVSIFNALQYYAHRLNASVPAGRSRMETFKSIYAHVGRGPTVPPVYRSGFRAAVGPPYRARIRARNASWRSYKAAILGGQMTYLVLWPSLFSAHYVNGIGFLEYRTGERYARIVDNWNRTAERYYCWDSLICRFMGSMDVVRARAAAPSFRSPSHGLIR